MLTHIQPCGSGVAQVLKIGDFARFGQVSIATLRHYDEIGLLKPTLVDGFTSYRYYSVSQLLQLNRILVLKALGFSLEQILLAANRDLPVEQLRGILQIQRMALEQRLADDQTRLIRITARITQIELEDQLSNHDVVLKTVAPMLIASRTVTIPTNQEVPNYLGAAFDAVYHHVSTCGAKSVGSCLAIWHQGAEVHADEVAEAAVPVNRAIPSSTDVRVYELAAAEVAASVYHGPFENFVQLHKALLSWIEANAYRVVGPYREIYLDHDANNLTDSATEIQYPIERAI